MAARKAGLKSDALEGALRARRRSPVFVRAQAHEHGPYRRRKPERVLVFTKGAPDILLARCSHELVGEEAAV